MHFYINVYGINKGRELLMKKLKSVLGVTLLEIMLVLAVAAMIIVLSVRYYQSSSANNYTNAVLQQIQLITANSDQLAGAATNAYGAVSTAAVTPLMPNQNMNAPWGGSISISGASATGYTVTINSMPADVCNLLRPKLTGKYTPQASCSTTTAAFTYSFNS
jgi:hypothetical protein